MLTMAPNLPPAQLSDEAMKLCAALLQIAVDPVAVTNRLNELNTATAALRAAIDEHAGVVAQANEIAAKENALAAAEQDVTARSQAVANAATAVDVSAAANVARSKSLDDREAEIAKREADITARQASLEARIQGYRQALG